MSDHTSESQGKGFKGLHQLGSKPLPVKESPVEPKSNADSPELPPEQSTVHPPTQPLPLRSQTAAPPSRGWVIGLGIPGAIVVFFIWVISISSTNNSPPTTSGESASTVADSAPPASPSGPSVTTPPVGNGLVMESDQIRYCVYESRRIKGAEQAVDNYSQASVDTFNAMVEDFNSRCSNFRYRQGALTPIESEANLMQAQLEREGRERMALVRSAYDAPAADAAAQSSADAAAASAAAAAAAAAASADAASAQVADTSRLGDQQPAILNEGEDQIEPDSSNVDNASRTDEQEPIHTTEQTYGTPSELPSWQSLKQDQSVPADDASKTVPSQ